MTSDDTATTGPVRARFAPSPTGLLHIGSAWTALFNWLLARHAGGQLLLRIEDTDAERSTAEHTELIFRTLEWLGLDWDGEPVYQSRNAERHVAAAQQLIASGHAYYCDCARDAIDERAKQRGGPPGYDGYCRDRDVPPGPDAVVRFRTPDEGSTTFQDAIRGEVSFPNKALEDFVIVRSSGVPMFLVANTVDDIDMEITHILRGGDLLNTVPKGLLLRQALGHPIDDLVFGHLPLIVNAQGKKFSKRDGAIAVEDYRDMGYLAPAFANYLTTLGWGAPDGVEIRPMPEIVGLFDYTKISKSPAMLDFKKLDNFNGDYIRALPVPEFIDLAQPFLHGERGPLPWRPDDYDEKVFETMAPLVQERAKTLAEVPVMVDFLFVDDEVVLLAPGEEGKRGEPGEKWGLLDDKSWQKVMVNGKDLAVTMLDVAIEEFSTLEPWSTQAINDVVIGYAIEHGIAKGKAQGPIRVATTGRSIGPPLWEALELLGREHTLARLRAARQRL